MAEKRVDVAIIGSGTAGLNATSKVGPAGKSFVLINGGEPGTTCARVGCMPSKALIQVAEDYHRRTHLGRYGVDGHEELKIDLPEAMEHVQDMRDTFVDRVLSNSTDNMGERFIEAYARFVDPHTLELDNGDRVVADKIVIATGSRPVVPEAWQAFGDKVITTDSFFEQEDLPESLAVVGLGVIGLELGQSLARLDVKVTGFDAAESIGGATDPEVVKTALEIMQRSFDIHLGQPVEISEEGDKLRVSAGDNAVVVDTVLCAIGRTPNLQGLALENSGLELDERGIPLFNRNTMQCGDSHIFIAGDLNGERPILHEAGDEGKIAGFNAASDSVQGFKRKLPLAINFCDPNICLAGARYDELDLATTAIGEVKLAPVGRAMIMGQNRGVIRVYADKASGKMLGSEMISVRGENLAHLLNWAITQGLTVGDLIRMPFYHPVIEEALQAALNNLYAQVEAKNEGAIKELYPL
ncbi:dihydrolipoyl dehydrogenase [Candidatus Endoriftia persephonae]|uniref:Dihydrolipoyl dehydrogenase n=3 Tax=Gammaproteobacteria TaxID=1236 RepID=G2FBJ2_9GAMM|nr:dihydrolipoyl dehydrogenase [Candidatus Endoriftia persephone]EGW55673.1 dihydrolipoyl dehydrogenase [endosymbiont of Tevnia jerichonana (vent Tica)]USF86336.1 dihydrolipoyl dehydrogenase [Candidatus Endoriftia persephone]